MGATRGDLRTGLLTVIAPALASSSSSSVRSTTSCETGGAAGGCGTVVDAATGFFSTGVLLGKADGVVVVRQGMSCCSDGPFVRIGVRKLVNGRMGIDAALFVFGVECLPFVCCMKARRASVGKILSATPAEPYGNGWLSGQRWHTGNVRLYLRVMLLDLYGLLLAVDLVDVQLPLIEGHQLLVLTFEHLDQPIVVQTSLVLLLLSCLPQCLLELKEVGRRVGRRQVALASTQRWMQVRTGH